MAAAVQTVVGAGAHEWIWAAIAAGDVEAVRAAPASFDICGTHPRYGSVLTAFLQGLLNLEGRFVAECRYQLSHKLVQELGRRGARPDVVIPFANIEVKGLYRNWRLTGSITPLQAVIRMRNDLVAVKYEAENATEDWEAGVDDDAKHLSELINKYAALVASSDINQGRLLVSDAVVGFWERCFSGGRATDADVWLVSPDGERIGAHVALLTKASPVVAALLSSGIGGRKDAAEGQSCEINVDEPAHVVRLLLSVIYTGCMPQDDSDETNVLTPILGMRVTVYCAFMSNNAQNQVLLPAGLVGDVQSVDHAGDICVKFDGIERKQWITKRNFGRLRSAADDATVQRQRELAAAFSLCRCWQVTGLEDLFADRLARELVAETLEITLEVAVLHEASSLKAACLALAQTSSHVRAAYDSGSYGPVVKTELQLLYGYNARKRPREPL